MKKQTLTTFSVLILLFLLIFISCDRNDPVIIDDTGENDSGADSLTDIDGNTYYAVKIGNQWWMKENLKTTKYNDGTDIPRVDSDTFWASTTEGAYCYYNNQEAYKDTFGLLYNYYAIESGKLCPEGWRVPTMDDYRTLLNYIDSTLNVENECDALRSSTGWKGTGSNDDANGIDLVGFKALPSGYRALQSIDTAVFYGIDKWVAFWSNTPNDKGTNVYVLSLSPLNPSNIDEGNLFSIWFHKNNGVSIRLIKDN